MAAPLERIAEMKELINAIVEWISFTHSLNELTRKTWNTSIEEGKWDGFGQYANGDKVFSVQIIFRVTDFWGEMIHSNEESREVRFFHKNEIPYNLNSHQAPFILDWLNGTTYPIIK